MGYKALYRKYRPDNFDGVVGQTAIIKTLQNIVKENKISHAYLFNGPRGTGKTSVAKIFAKAINCLEPKNGIPCGTCSVCMQIDEDGLNDIIEIDAASNNGVDEIRDLKSKINLAPAMCQYKVYIIDEVHMLSIGAFNALLKTLEEPPHHVVFILATTEIHKLPLTIISRCQNFNFKKITEEQMMLRLNYIIEKEHINIDSVALYEIAKVSDGGMRDAIGLLEQLLSFTNNNITLQDVELLSSTVPRNDIATMFENIVTNNVELIFQTVDRFYQEGKDFTRLAEDLIVFLKDILLYRKAKKYFNEQNTYNIEAYTSVMSKLDEDRIYNYMDLLNKLSSELRISGHPKIIFEITLLKMMDTKSIPAEKVLADAPDDEKEKKVIEHQEIPQKSETKDSRVLSTKEDEVTKNTVLPFVKTPLYKKILINNTLAVAEKKLLAEFKSKGSQLQTFMLNKDFKSAATILLDGEIVGASNDNIIYTYPYDSVVEKADAMQEEIESLVDNMLGHKYRVINITTSDWSEIRPYYVKLMKQKKKIEILPETDMSALKKSKKVKKRDKEVEEAINMFGEDLIEIK